MKNPILFFLFVVSCPAFSQGLVQRSSSGFTFSDVVAVDSLDRDKLWQNAKIWIGEAADIKTITRDSAGGKISGLGSFMVYSQSGVLQKVSGRVTYRYEVLVKNGKYRYLFDDFVFHYYQQDRNFKMTETAKTRLLTDTKAKGWQKLWDQHRKTTQSKMAGVITDLNARLTYKPKTQKPKEKVEW